jgi:hypothetical protein
VDPPPDGWSGPAALFESTASPLPAPPSCPDAFSDDVVDGNDGLTAPTAQCGCTCAATGQTCGDVSVTFYSAAGCTSSCTSYPVGAACVNVTTSCPFAIATAPAPQGGGCNPSSSKVLPATSWSTVGRVCAPGATPPAAGCSGAQVCVAQAPAPFDTSLCVYQAGDLPCPAGTYGGKHLLYGSVLDVRGCSACACGMPVSGGGCMGELSLFTASTCPSADTRPPYVLGSGCQQVGALGGLEAPGLEVTQGSCPTSGGNPQGAATPTSPVTVCCAQ